LGGFIMAFNFDEIIERKNTDSIKYDLIERLGMPEDILPLWVADMDFKAPDCVINELVEKSRHGIFGYSESGEDYFEAMDSWFKKRHGWQIHESWLVKTPGVVNAVATAIRTLTEKGDFVLIQQPVYHPFAESVRVNDRRLSVNELIYENGRYSIDFADFKEKIINDKVKLFILCNPHNPVGRVWTRDELIKMGDICLRHGVIVLSDEIHMDFIYSGNRHLVFSSLRPEYENISIICTAPSKTFNLAGLHISNIFIAEETMREAFKREISRSGFSQLGIMGMTACRAAYKGGGPWLDELMVYLGKNLEFLRGFIKEKLPEVRLVEPEGSYLVWLDFKALGLSQEELDDLIVQKAHLWLNSGTIFGSGGEGFQRLNIACPQKTLEAALVRLETAIKSLR
jgi:cystathionine beta-lyase